MTSKLQPFLTLNNGQRMPLMGFGTLMIQNRTEENAARMVETALEIGYRHIDTAQIYRTESAVGVAVNNFISKGTVKRDEIFITTKVSMIPESGVWFIVCHLLLNKQLWRNSARQQDVVPSLKMSLERLSLPYVDLFLIHWPTALQPGETYIPRDENGKIIYAEEIDYVDTWKGMEECVDLGLTKSIGVSNFNSKQLQRLLDNCRIKPANNQIESHPYLTNNKLIQFCHSKGISIAAYAPLAGFNDKYRQENGWPMLLEDPILTAIAHKHKATVAQVALQFQMRRGLSVLPKSDKKERLLENFQSLDLKLTDEDMKNIEALDRNMRLNAEFPDHKHYPFHEEF